MQVSHRRLSPRWSEGTPPRHGRGVVSRRRSGSVPTFLGRCPAQAGALTAASFETVRIWPTWLM
ncbi:hypothetical protein ACFPM0_16500 [Pseudonocardia sulfidoxydans]|uniref:hypothetical protein n=1 Tax=Pseudonocardia sulfidoxydans TaxID=54011 RepID=UPI00360E9F80